MFEIHDDEINVDEIMSRIQERARQRALQGPIPSGAMAPRAASLLPAAAYPSGDEVRNLEILNANFDPESTLPERTRLRGLKRLAFWAVRPFARAQASFNAAATALLSRHVDQIDAVVQCLSALEERVGGLDELRGVMDNRVTDLEKALDGLCAGLAGREVGPDGRLACLKAAAAELHELEDHERALGQLVRHVTSPRSYSVHALATKIPSSRRSPLKPCSSGTQVPSSRTSTFTGAPVSRVTGMLMVLS